MAANFDSQIRQLHLAANYVGREVNYENEKDAPGILSAATSSYFQYFAIHESAGTIPAFNQDPRVQNYDTLRQYTSPVELQTIADYFQSLGQKEIESYQKHKPIKEESTVPADLESLVYQYKEAQSEKKFENDESANSVAEAVRRARKVWDEKNRIQTILHNREANQYDRNQDTRDQYFVNAVDPKSGDKESILANAEIAARAAAVAEAAILAREYGVDVTKNQIDLVTEKLVHLGLTGYVDINDPKNLDIVTKSAFHDTGAYFDSPIVQLDEEYHKLNEILRDNPYSDEPEAQEKKIAELVSSSKDKIESENHHSTQELQKSLTSDIKYEDKLDQSRRTIEKIQGRLTSAVPNPTLPFQKATPLQQHGAELESLLREQDKSLRISESPEGARTVAVLQSSNYQGRNLSPEAAHLVSVGVTSKHIDKLEETANANPNSKEARFLRDNKDVIQQVRHQLSKFENTELGKQLGVDKLNTISKGVTNLYNSLPSPVQNAAKIALDPRGTANNWINRQIGQYIGKRLVKDTSNAAVKQLGEFLINDGLQLGVKKFAGQVVTQVAAKAGITLAAEGGLTGTLAVALGIPTAGASLVIGAILFAIQVGYELTLKKWLTGLKNDLGIEGEFGAGDMILLASVPAGAAVVAGSAVVGGVIFVGRAVRTAIITGISVIIICSIFVGFYILFSFAAAPMLSTFVQLDSTEKVQYPLIASSSAELGPVSCSNLKWPFSGTHPITQGPRQKTPQGSPPQICTHHGGIAESVDFSVPVGTPILAILSGKVTYAGSSSDGWGINVLMAVRSDDGKNFSVRYAHLSKVTVQTGQTVEAGKQIGISGNTGYSTGPHLHLGYTGMAYNSCPAGGFQVNEDCCYAPHSCNQP